MGNRKCPVSFLWPASSLLMCGINMSQSIEMEQRNKVLLCVESVASPLPIFHHKDLNETATYRDESIWTNRLCIPVVPVRPASPRTDALYCTRPHTVECLTSWLLRTTIQLRIFSSIRKCSRRCWERSRVGEHSSWVATFSWAGLFSFYAILLDPNI